MANTIPTPYMQLPNPVPGVDPGPDYANNIQACFNRVDQHSHTGTPDGQKLSQNSIALTGPLPFGGFAATGLQATTFNQQSSFTTPNSLFVGTDGNLYFNDGASDPSIKITSGGGLAAFSSGITSGTNSASFVGSTLVVNANSTTPANIQGAAIEIGNNVSSSNFVTLQPVTGLTGNYTLILPTLPGGAPLFLTIDNAGNIGTAGDMQAGQIGTGHIVGNQIAPATITGGNVAAATLTGTNIQSGSIPPNSLVPASLTGINMATNISLPGKAVQENFLNIVVSNTNATNSLAVVRGVVDSGGGIISGEGFSVSHTGTGAYTITYSTAFEDLPAFVPTALVTSPTVIVAVISSSPTAASILMEQDAKFNFIAVGQRA